MTSAAIKQPEIENRASDAPTYPWRGFRKGSWQDCIDVRSFIQTNYTPYAGDHSFLKGPTVRTSRLWKELTELLKQERDAGGVLDADTRVVGTVASHGPGYINRDLEQIVGVQTDKPLKRALMPYGGLRIAQKALHAHGREMDEETAEFFVKHSKTKHDGVFAC